MGLSYASRISVSFLFGLCVAVFSVPVMASGNPLSGTTLGDLRASFWGSPRYPAGVIPPSVASSPASSLAVSSSSFSATGTGLIRGSGFSFPATSTASWPASVGRSMLKSCVSRPFACNMVGVAVGVGIDQWMNSQNLRLDDAGDWEQKRLAPIPEPIPPNASWLYPTVHNNSNIPSYSVVVAPDPANSSRSITCLTGSNPSPVYTVLAYTSDRYAGGSNSQNGWCLIILTSYAPPDAGPFVWEPIAIPSVLGLADSYSPVGADLSNLQGSGQSLGAPSSVSLSLSNPSPQVTSTQSSSVTSDGQTLTTTKTTTVTPSVTENGTGSPIFNTTIVTETVTKNENGETVKSETDSVTPTPIPSQPPEPPLTGCDLYQPFCDFWDWVREPFNETADFDSLAAVPFDPNAPEYSLTENNSCPAPIVFNLTAIGGQQVSFEWDLICDFMEYIRALVLAGAYLATAHLYLRALRG